MTPEPVSYPARLEMKPARFAPKEAVRLPGSKSMTNRALALAALYPPPAGPDGSRVCTVRGALRSDDTEVMMDNLRRLGFCVETEWDAPQPLVHVDSELLSACQPRPGVAPARTPIACVPVARLKSHELFAGNSGTSMRFLTAMVSLGQGRYRLDGVARMRQRPIEDLLAVLRQLGVNAFSENHNGCPPIVIEAGGLTGGPVRIKGDVSSQFLSALLMVAPLASKPMTIDVDGPLVSQPYVSLTLAMMRDIGLNVDVKPGPCYEVPLCGPPKVVGRETIVIEPDASAASYFFAAAAITGGEASVAGLDGSSKQGDIRFVEILERMGCQVLRQQGALGVRGRPLKGIDVDMNDVSDTVMTLAVVACFASGPTTIRNVAHIRHKETDRLAALAAELRRIGAVVEELADGLKITPRPLRGAVIETYQDHRMAMSLALAGLRVPGIIIDNPGCVAKTYPRFF